MLTEGQCGIKLNKVSLLCDYLCSMISLSTRTWIYSKSYHKGDFCKQKTLFQIYFTVCVYLGLLSRLWNLTLNSTGNIQNGGVHLGLLNSYNCCGNFFFSFLNWINRDINDKTTFILLVIFWIATMYHSISYSRACLENGSSGGSKILCIWTWLIKRWWYIVIRAEVVHSWW